MFGFFKKKKKENTKTTSTASKVAADAKTVSVIKKRADLLKTVSITKGIKESTKSRVALVLDYSGSMDYLYRTGFVQELLERLMPLGINFDDNGAIDVILFHNHAKDLGEVTLSNFTGFIKREILAKHSMGGTSYASAINLVVDKYKDEPGDPVYCIFITDGECMTESASEDAITKASKYGIFWQFVGIGDESFSFLKRLDDRKVDNANFFKVKKLKKMSDEELYSKMMAEYPEYLLKAEQVGIIN
jgi:hypothetical protein